MDFKQTEPCTCDWCVSCCKNVPGWFDPAGAQVVMDAGLPLMLDYWCADGDLPHIDILSPPMVGFENRMAPSWRQGICSFLKDGRCSIHDMKPLECAAVIHENHPDHVEDGVNIHREVAKLWNTDEGRAVVARWKALNGYTG